MKYKTSELTGRALDAAVALAEKRNVRFNGTHLSVSALGGFDTCQEGFFPSENWAYGGPIIDRMTNSSLFSRLMDYGNRVDWYCSIDDEGDKIIYPGETALIAAMRAFVFSKLGEVVDL